MRVALVHSFYSSGVPSGENRVVEDQLLLLAQHGLEVMLVEASTDQEQSRRFYGPRTALRVLARTGVDIRNDLRDFVPDVVHVHNTFPNIGSRWLRHWAGPVVMSVHNYRAACSNGLLLRNGRICHDCFEPVLRWMPAVRHACYRGSRVATSPVALSRSGFREDLERSGVTAVTLSDASDAVFRRMTQERIPSVVIPNFVEDYSQGNIPSRAERRGWLVVSRLSPEKGVGELLNIWPSDQELTVIGDGPETASIARISQEKPNIHLIPSLPRARLLRVFGEHVGLILPSRWHEVAPQVVVEAMCAGLPVVALGDNDVAPMVELTGAGRPYQDATELATSLADINTDWDNFSARARATYLDRWTPDHWLGKMMELYRSLTE